MTTQTNEETRIRQLTDELQAVRGRNLVLESALMDIRTVLRSSPGRTKGNSLVHYAVHKADSALAS